MFIFKIKKCVAQLNLCLFKMSKFLMKILKNI